MPTIKYLGGGDLYLSPSKFTRQRMSQSIIPLIGPLLLSQLYVDSVQMHTGQSVKYNLDGWRYRNHLETNCFQTLCYRTLREFIDDEKLTFKPWIKGIKKQHVADVIIHRSPRYRNPDFPWKSVIEKYSGRIAFVGLEFEHQEFCRRFRCNMPYQRTLDFLEVAQIIAGSKLFIGNQSCPYAIAEGMKHNTIQETFSYSPDCIFKRRNAQYVAGRTLELPSI